jgi:hypothetical protein
MGHAGSQDGGSAIALPLIYVAIQRCVAQTSWVYLERDMIGGLMKTTSRFALIAAAGLMMVGGSSLSAKAADLGGVCCAYL